MKTQNNGRFAQFKNLCHQAVKCRDCFNGSIPKIKSPGFDIAQPRWIGKKYWVAKKRILVLTINPGKSAAKEDPDKTALEELRKFRKSGDGHKLREILAAQRADMPRWGARGKNTEEKPGRFLEFYREKMGLKIDEGEVAFGNIAWCAAVKRDKNNKWVNASPKKMLDECYKKHTSKLLKILEPDIVILSGSGAYTKKIREVLPKCKGKVISTFHYAHRKGNSKEGNKLKRVRKLLK